MNQLNNTAPGGTVASVSASTHGAAVSYYDSILRDNHVAGTYDIVAACGFSNTTAGGDALLFYNTTISQASAPDLACSMSCKFAADKLSRFSGGTGSCH